MNSSDLVRQLLSIIETYGDIPVRFDSTSSLMAPTVDRVMIGTATNNLPWGMKLGEKYVLLETKR